MSHTGQFRSKGTRSATFFTAITFVSLLAVAGAPTQHAQPTSSSRYHVVHGWPVLPEGRVLGSVAGCAVDSHDNVFVFHRNDRTWPDSDELVTTPIARPTITVFDGRTGRVLADWGENRFAMPHGLSVDRNDNVWVTDVALQQVFKFSHDGQLLLTVGERGMAGNDATHFNQPTEVAVAADGSFYVSDGYRNTRVMKFSPTGAFLFQWGTKGSGPGEFDLPHGAAVDRTGRVYVSDRTNSRVQIFDPSGHYIGEWKGKDIGRPYDVALASNGTAFIADGGDQPQKPPDRSGVAVVRPDGSVIERFGRWGNYDGQFEMAHCVAVAKDGSVYVGDITGGRVQKFVHDGR
jgi:peptidylamidoglycolate lyase